MIVDTSALLAYFDSLEPQHDAVAAVIDRADVCVVSPYVVAELDYLVSTRYGRAAELAVLQELIEGDWELAVFDQGDVQAAVQALASYDQVVGLADISCLILAQRYGTGEIASLDRRHFSFLHLPGRPPLSVVP